MSRTTAWKLECADVSNTPVSGYAGVVTCVHWRLAAIDDSTSPPTVVSDIYGCTDLPPPAPDNPDFVSKTASAPDADMLLGWAKAVIGDDAVAAAEAAALDKLDAFLTPPTSRFIPQS